MHRIRAIGTARNIGCHGNTAALLMYVKET
jgi:hypothetical protein